MTSEHAQTPSGEAGAMGAALRGGGVRVGGFLLGQALTVGAIALLLRHLGVDEGGRYVTVLSLVAIVGGLTDLGLTTLTVRELGAGAAPGLLERALGVRLVSTVVGVGLAAAFAVAAGYPARMVAGVALAGAALVVTNVGATLTARLLVELRAGRVAAADLARQAVAAVLVAAGVALGFGLDGFLALLVVPALVGTVVIADGTGLVRPTLRGGGALLRATVPFAVAAAASVLFFRVALVELSVIGSARQTGLLAASFRVVEVLAVLPGLAVSTAFPVFSAAAAAGDRERLRAAVGRSLEVCAVAGGALALGLALGAPAVIAVVAGGKFDAAVPVLRVQGLALLFSFLAASWGFALLALGRERALMWVNVVGVGIAAVVGGLLVSAHGARGAALATVLGEAGLAVAFGVLLGREGLAPAWRPVAVVALAGGAGACVALLGLPAALAALVGLAVYGAVVLAFWGWRGG